MNDYDYGGVLALSEINIGDILQSQDDDIESLIGIDILNLMGNQDSDNNGPIVDDEEEEEEKVVKIKYSDAKKKKLLEAFKTTYVNDYGKNDPYHIDSENSLASQVRNEIHAIYGNRSIVQYIIAMRKVFKVYREMYDKSVQRLATDFPTYVKMIVDGNIAAPFNHPLIRTNLPEHILLRFILNESLNPEDIKQFISGGNAKTKNGMVFDLTNVEEDINTPVEYEILPEIIQKRILQSWLSGKLKRKGLDDNYSKMVYGLTTIYDKVGLNDPSFFKFDEPLSHHADIISWKNVRRSYPEHIPLKGYTEKDLEEIRRGRLIRDIMSDDTDMNPEVSMSKIFARMEQHGEESGIPITTLALNNKFKLYSQGILGVKTNKYGRETYIYRDKRKVKNTKIETLMNEIDRKAEIFNELTNDMNERFNSIQFSSLIDEVKKEQDLIKKYGIGNFTEDD